MLSPERQSARMSKIKNGGLDQCGKVKALTGSAVKGLTPYWHNDHTLCILCMKFLTIGGLQVPAVQVYMPNTFDQRISNILGSVLLWFFSVRLIMSEHDSSKTTGSSFIKFRGRVGLAMREETVGQVSGMI